MIPFFDLKRQTESLQGDLDKAFERVFRSSHFILGGEGEAFEREFADYNGSRYAVGVNSGTDALILSLKALGVGRGDEVIVPSLTAIPTI